MTNLTIVQVNVGRPALLPPHENCSYARDKEVVSGIVKQRVEDPFVAVGPQGLEGDQQADERILGGKRVHGGVLKAVYAYPLEHLALWEEELPDGASPGISFGENLTVMGATEKDVHIGDVYSCNGVALRVTTPRRPCYKLGRHLGDGVPQRMNATGRCGWYFGVVRPGQLPTTGAVLALAHRNEGAPTIAEVFAAKIKQDPSIPGIPG